MTPEIEQRVRGRSEKLAAFTKMLFILFAFNAVVVAGDTTQGVAVLSLERQYT